VEVRIARADVKVVADGMQGGGAPRRHEINVTKAMSVRLRAPEGGFIIEAASPETQWIDGVLGPMTDDYASWRWSVTPLERGHRRLQVVVAARTSSDGLAAETALPDQVIEVRVKTNYGRVFKRLGGWAVAAIAGGLLAHFGEGLPPAAMQLMQMVVK
ncbi:MAG: Clp protease, partial [Hyphomicrobiaceae bacterium]